jgi:signal transduction histidine kinase
MISSTLFYHLLLRLWQGYLGVWGFLWEAARLVLAVRDTVWFLRRFGFHFLLPTSYPLVSFLLLISISAFASSSSFSLTLDPWVSRSAARRAMSGLQSAAQDMLHARPCWCWVAVYRPPKESVHVKRIHKS